VQVGDAAGDRILDRDHGEFRLATCTAAIAASNVGQASVAMDGKAARQAISEFAPASP